MSFIKDMVENPHPVYAQNAAFWQFLLQSYEGGQAYTGASVAGQAVSNNDALDSKITVNGRKLETVIASNLFQHPKERTQDYNRRVAMSYYYNFCAPIIDIYSDHLFKQNVDEDFGSLDTTVQAIKDNIDRRGSSIMEFRRNVADVAQIYGHCFLVVDSPAISDTDILTRQDQIDFGAFPYVSIYTPNNVINWSLDENGSAYWVLLCETTDANKDPMAFDKNAKYKKTYRLWTREEWVLYDSEYQEIARGVHALGEVPIVCVYNKRSRRTRAFLGISDLSDISFIARDIYNASSELRQILRDQTFAFLALQGTSNEYNEVEIGTNKGIVYPEGRNVPQYVSPPTDNAQVYFQHIDRQISKIYQIAKLDSGGVSGKVDNPNTGIADQQSGVSKAWDFNQTNSALSSKSSNMEDAEQKMWHLIAAWEGTEFDGSISYPDDFSVSSLMDDLREAEMEARVELGATFNTEVRKAIIHKKFPRLQDSDLLKMEKEVEQIFSSKLTPAQSLAERARKMFNQNTDTVGKTGGQNV